MLRKSRSFEVVMGDAEFRLQRLTKSKTELMTRPEANMPDCSDDKVMIWIGLIGR